MADGTVFPAFIRATFEDSSQGFPAFERAANDSATRMRQKFEQNFNDIQAAMTRALATPRNAGGSLDLGVAEQRQAAAAAEARAIAAREVAAAMRAAAAAEGDYSQKARLSLAAAEALEVQERQAAAAAHAHADALEQVQLQLNKTASATDMVVAGAKRGTDAFGAATNSAKSMRFASLQVGQQMQDAVIQWQAGTNALVILTQQGSQAAFAMSGLEGRIGAVARFMAGPFGTGVLIGITVLGLLSNAFNENEKAAKSAQKASEDFAHRQLDLANFFDLATGKILEQNQALLQNAVLKRQQQVDEKLGTYRSNVRTAFDAARAVADRAAPDTFAERGLGIKNVDPAIAQAVQSANGSVVLLDRNLRELGKNRPDLAGTIATVSDAASQAVLAVRDINKLNQEILSLQSGSLTPSLRTPPRGGSGAGASGSNSSSGGRASEEADAFAQAQEEALRIVQQISREFDEQPRLIERAASASQDAQQVIDAYKDKTDEASIALVRAAQAARDLADSAPERAFQEIVDQEEQSLEIQRLITEGRYEEAEALRTIYAIEHNLGTLDEERRQVIRDIIAEREREARLADIARQKQQIYLNALGDVQQNIRYTIASMRTEGLKSIPQFIDRLRGTYDNLIADYIVEKVFGPTFRALEDKVLGRNPVDEANTRLAASVDTTGGSVDELGTAAARCADALEEAATRMSRSALAANDNGRKPTSAEVEAFESLQDIVVTANGKASAKTAYAQEPDNFFGEALISLLRGAGINISDDSSKKLGGIIGSAFQGAAIGQIAGGLVLGEKRGQSKEAAIGGAIGGAIGKATGIPGGDIIGSILGGIAGGLFYKPKYGTASVTSADAAAQLTGSNKTTANNAGSLAGSVQDGLRRIADQLGGALGDFSLAIGTWDGKFRVNTNATNKALHYNNFTSSTLYDFGEDQEAAIRFAIMDALKDGAIKGIRDGTKRLLQSGQDLDRALDKALQFEQVFRDLKTRTDPVGAALDTVNAKFENLKKIFDEAGASAQEYADLEKLYGYERAEAIKEASEKMTGALKGLLADLTTGDNGRSLRDRLAAAKAVYDPLAADLAAGKQIDYEAFADAARTVLDIQRQLDGSQSGYFDMLDQITALTQTALAGQQALIDAATGATVSFPGATANDNQPVVGAIDQQTQALIDALESRIGSRLGAANENLGAIIELLSSGINAENRNKLARANF